MRFLHTMINVTNLEESVRFYRDLLGMKIFREHSFPEQERSLVFLGYDDEVVELIYHWGIHSYELGTGWGHMAIGVDDAYQTCDELSAKGVKVIGKPKLMPGGKVIGFIEDPTGYTIELIQPPKA